MLRPENRLSDMSTDSITRGPDHYGSQTTLLPREYNAANLHASQQNQAFVASRLISTNYTPIQGISGYYQPGSQVDGFVQQRNAPLYSSASALDARTVPINAQQHNYRYIDASRQRAIGQQQSAAVQNQIKYAGASAPDAGLSPVQPVQSQSSQPCNDVNRLNVQAVIEPQSRTAQLSPSVSGISDGE